MLYPFLLLHQFVVGFDGVFGDGLEAGIDLPAAFVHDESIAAEGFIGAIETDVAEDEVIEVRAEITIMDA